MIERIIEIVLHLSGIQRPAGTALKAVAKLALLQAVQPLQVYSALNHRRTFENKNTHQRLTAVRRYGIENGIDAAEIVPRLCQVVEKRMGAFAQLLKSQRTARRQAERLGGFFFVHSLQTHKVDALDFGFRGPAGAGRQCQDQPNDQNLGRTRVRDSIFYPVHHNHHRKAAVTWAWPVWTVPRR